MSDIGDLRERLVGRRFYDRKQEESFTVVGITSRPPLALLQYDDGVAWDEGASNFTVNEDVAQRAARCGRSRFGAVPTARPGTAYRPDM